MIPVRENSEVVIIYPHIWLVGGFNPSEKYESQLEGWHPIYYGKYKKWSKPPTRWHHHFGGPPWSTGPPYICIYIYICIYDILFAKWSQSPVCSKHLFPSVFFTVPRRRQCWAAGVESQAWGHRGSETLDLRKKWYHRTLNHWILGYPTIYTRWGLLDS